MRSAISGRRALIRASTTASLHYVARQIGIPNPDYAKRDYIETILESKWDKDIAEYLIMRLKEELVK